MAGLRATKDFSFLPELDATVGKAIRVFGPQNILQVIPLNLTGTIKDVLLDQSWLLPLLREHISHTELSHFVSYFLPIAFQLQTTGKINVELFFISMFVTRFQRKIFEKKAIRQTLPFYRLYKINFGHFFRVIVHLQRTFHPV